ncbi:hypothetical protein NCPPB3923_19950 [Burkholderia glumae]|nr:hypothetical protein NCPPB3923_19950 [Burkholderia glumae]
MPMSLAPRRQAPGAAARGSRLAAGRRRAAGTQQIMLRGRLKTVDSDGAGGPNRDKPHFCDA